MRVLREYRFWWQEQVVVVSMPETDKEKMIVFLYPYIRMEDDYEQGISRGY